MHGRTACMPQTLITPRDSSRNTCASAGSVPVWYIGGYWTLPLGWLTNSILINEFSAPRWQTPYIYDPSVGCTPLDVCVCVCERV